MPGFLPLNATFSGLVSGPPIFRSAGALGTGTSATGLGLPSGLTSGDFLFLIIASSATVATPTGYTVTNATGAGTALWVFYKIAGGSESVPSLSLNGASTAMMFAYSNVNASPINVQAVSVASGTSTTASTTSITTTKANTIVISCFEVTGGTSNTLSHPASTNFRGETNSGSAFRNFLVQDETQTGAGASTVRSSTVGASLAWSAWSMAITTT